MSSTLLPLTKRLYDVRYMIYSDSYNIVCDSIVKSNYAKWVHQWWNLVSNEVIYMTFT